MSSSATTPIKQLLPTYMESIISNVYCMAVTPFSIFVNILTIILIRKNKNLHSTCFALIALQAIISCQMALGFFTRAALTFTNFPTTTRLICTLIHVPTFTSASPLSAFVPCAIGLDRLIALTWIQQYKVISKHLWRVAVIVCVFIESVHSISAMATTPVALVSCSGPLISLDSTFTLYYLSIGATFFTLSVIIYAYMEIGIRLRKRKVSPDGQLTSAQEASLQQQLSLLPLIRALLICYIIFAVIPHFILTIAPYIDHGRHLNRLNLHGGAAKVSLTFIDFFVLTVRCSEFRKSLRALFRVAESNPSVMWTA